MGPSHPHLTTFGNRLPCFPRNGSLRSAVVTTDTPNSAREDGSPGSWRSRRGGRRPGPGGDRRRAARGGGGADDLPGAGPGAPALPAVRRLVMDRRARPVLPLVWLTFVVAGVLVTRDEHIAIEMIDTAPPPVPRWRASSPLPRGGDRGRPRPRGLGADGHPGDLEVARNGHADVVALRHLHDRVRQRRGPRPRGRAALPHPSAFPSATWTRSRRWLNESAGPLAPHHRPDGRARADRLRVSSGRRWPTC